MSRNFDLMQQLEIDRGAHLSETVEPAFPVPAENGSRNGHVEWASGEAMRLVQKSFLLQTQEPPRVVAGGFSDDPAIGHAMGQKEISAHRTFAHLRIVLRSLAATVRHALRSAKYHPEDSKSHPECKYRCALQSAGPLRQATT